jgi:hypothetical protein
MRIFRCCTVASAAMLAAVCILVLASLAAASGDTERVAKLESVRKSKIDSVVSFTADSFRRYIEVSGFRSYSLIVMFTADESMCKPCEVMRKEFGATAKEYYAAPKSLRPSHPVFFADFKLSPGDVAFLKDYGIQHVPMVYHFEKGSLPKHPSKLVDPGPNSYNLQEEGIGVNPIKSFVNSRTRSKLAITRANYEIPFVSTVRALFPVIFSVLFGIALLAVFMGWFRQPFFWFVCVVVVYMYSVGGGHYSWIHNSAFAVVDRSGKMQFIAEGSRNQYVAEGIFVSLTCSTISALVIAINELPKFIAAKGSQTFVGISLFVLTLAAIMSLLLLYNLKMPSYLIWDQ